MSETGTERRFRAKGALGRKALDSVAKLFHWLEGQDKGRLTYVDVQGNSFSYVNSF
jgi:hypothetical protein